MAPVLTLDEIMPLDEARTWRSRIQTARETDLFGGLAKVAPPTRAGDEPLPALL